MNKNCPGSRTIKDPTPEYFNCPNCGAEVEVWTHELSYPCSSCGTRVFREQRPSCIDWCPYVEECIGPEVYKSLKPATKGTPAEGEIASPLDVLNQEHDEAIKRIVLLRAATLCLRAGAKASGLQPTQAIERAWNDLRGVLEFVDNELRTHFRREEELLFPLVEKHIGREGGPTQLLLTEHADLWREHDQLKDKLEGLKNSDVEHRSAAATELFEIGSRFARSLRGHIDKENASLLPIAKSVLSEKELSEIGREWRA